MSFKTSSICQQKAELIGINLIPLFSIFFAVLRFSVFLRSKKILLFRRKIIYYE